MRDVAFCSCFFDIISIVWNLTRRAKSRVDNLV